MITRALGLSMGLSMGLLIPSVSVAGFNAVTNQSLTNAAATPAAPRTMTVVGRVQRAGSKAPSSATFRRPGSVRKNNASRTPAQMKLRERA